MLTVTKKCSRCNTNKPAIVEDTLYSMWSTASLIRQALPYLTVTQREAKITSLCKDCQGRLYMSTLEDQELEARTDEEWAVFDKM
jgi:hypothetical protein